MPNLPGLSYLEYARYRSVLGQSTDDVVTLNPVARAALIPPWMTPELTATEAARTRIRRWAGLGDLSDTPERRKAIIARITIRGDDTLLGPVRAALEHLPVVVLDHSRAHAVLLPVGRAAGGFATLLPAPDAAASEARRLLVVEWPHRRKAAAAVFLGRVLHETAHAWLLDAPPADSGPVTEAEAAEAHSNREVYLAAGAAWGLLEDHVIEPRMKAEAEACRLALSWGAPFQDATGCAANARRAIEAEAAAAPPLATS